MEALVATVFLTVEEAPAEADTSAMGTVPLGAGGITGAEDAGVLMTTAAAGVTLGATEVERGSVGMLGFNGGATGSVEISETRVSGAS